MAKRYWLFKSEPDVFSYDDLLAAPDQTTCWEGVRNYQARNLLRDEMKVGDGVLFYHSNAKPQVIAGTAKIVRAGYPDPTQFDKRSKYYDPKSSADEPRWWMVDVEYVDTLPHLVALDQLKSEPALEDMVVTKRSRLSVQPVRQAEYDIVVRMGGRG